MPLRMEVGSSGITLLRDLEVLWLGELMLPAGSNARTVCKFAFFQKAFNNPKNITEKTFEQRVNNAVRTDKDN